MAGCGLGGKLCLLSMPRVLLALFALPAVLCKGGTCSGYCYRPVLRLLL